MHAVICEKLIFNNLVQREYLYSQPFTNQDITQPCVYKKCICYDHSCREYIVVVYLVFHICRDKFDGWSIDVNLNK